MLGKKNVLISGSDKSLMHQKLLSRLVCCYRFIGELTLSAIKGDTQPVDVIQIKVIVLCLVEVN